MARNYYPAILSPIDDPHPKTMFFSSIVILGFLHDALASPSRGPPPSLSQLEDSSATKTESDPTTTVVVAGATGRTGKIIYELLRAKKHLTTRAIVRSQHKAQESLHCGACSEQDGIFVADIARAGPYATPDTPTNKMDRDAMGRAFNGVESPAHGVPITSTSAVPHCDPYPNCTYPDHGWPIEVDWNGGRNLLRGFLSDGSDGHVRLKKTVVLISTMGTTSPTQPFDRIGPNGHISFYKLNLEAWLGGIGGIGGGFASPTTALTSVIVKPCGLTDKPPRTKELVVGHDDELSETPPLIARADVARVVVQAVQEFAAVGGNDGGVLRFDLCARDSGKVTQDRDLANLLDEARWKWNSGEDERTTPRLKQDGLGTTEILL